MSVLIKGMEMPKACYECRMYEADIYYCAAAERDIDISDSSVGRCSFCPLVPVPPHGRLIDADALEALFWDGQCYFTENIKYKIKNIETIIPAEEGEA